MFAPIMRMCGLGISDCEGGVEGLELSDCVGHVEGGFLDEGVELLAVLPVCCGEESLCCPVCCGEGEWEFGYEGCDLDFGGYCVGDDAGESGCLGFDDCDGESFEERGEEESVDCHEVVGGVWDVSGQDYVWGEVEGFDLFEDFVLERTVAAED